MRDQVPAQARLAAEFEAFASLGSLPVARFDAAIGVLLLDGQSGGADLTFKVGRTGFDAVEFGAGFVGQALLAREFRHPLPFAGLAVAEFAESFLGFGHRAISSN